MPNQPRLIEVRLLVVVSVDLSDPDLVEILKATHPSSVPRCVADEVTSNLESVSYVDAVIVSQL